MESGGGGEGGDGKARGGLIGIRKDYGMDCGRLRILRQTWQKNGILCMFDRASILVALRVEVGELGRGQVYL